MKNVRPKRADVMGLERRVIILPNSALNQKAKRRPNFKLTTAFSWKSNEKNSPSLHKQWSMISLLQWPKKCPFNFSSTPTKILPPTMILNSPIFFLNSAEMSKISPNENTTRLENNGDATTSSLSLKNWILVPKHFDINQGKYFVLTYFHSLQKKET